MLNGLDLFSGIGGLTLAISEWVRPVAYCEIEPYAAAVLFSRMLDGSIPQAPIFPDVRKLTARVLPPIDIIYGGFPCQDVSLAGLRKGLDGERTGLFFEVVRLVAECRPAFVFLENVPGIKPYRPAIHSAFENLGYQCRDGTLAAAHVGACHIRNRWWFVAYCKRKRQLQPERLERDERRRVDHGSLEVITNTDKAFRAGLPRRTESENAAIRNSSEHATNANQKRFNGGGMSPEKKKAAGHAVKLIDHIRGRLNPPFVEQMMMYPAGWTELHHSATRLCPRRRGKHSKG